MVQLPVTLSKLTPFRSLVIVVHGSGGGVWSVNPLTLLSLRVCACDVCCVLCGVLGPSQNFYPGPVMTVAIGGQPCADVVVDDSLTSLQCIAPPGPGIGDVQLRVTVDGSGTASHPFEYNSPVVGLVVGTPCDADAPCPIQVR
jgi:hypothetical protein